MWKYYLVELYAGGFIIYKSKKELKLVTTVINNWFGVAHIMEVRTPTLGELDCFMSKGPRRIAEI